LVSLKEDFSMFQNYLVMDNVEMQKRLKECLGDSNGVTTDNVEVYDWDYGTFTNPHLIKLVDATQDAYVEYLRADGSSYKVLQTDANNDWVDSASQTYPVSLLCNNGKEWVYASAGSGSASLRHWNQAGTSNGEYAGSDIGSLRNTYLGEWGFCKALNPPGFYAIIYFDDCGAGGQSKKFDSNTNVACDASNPWRVMTAVNRGEGNSAITQTYDSSTKFHVFTTKGTMQQVSQYAQIYTSNDLMSTTKRLASYHSNVIHSANTTDGMYASAGTTTPNVYANNGQMDCETMESMIGPASTHGVSVGALDCLDYGDKVFFLNLGDWDPTKCIATNTYRGASYTDTDALSCEYTPTRISYATNPQYVNMYTVKKISFEPASYDTADSARQVDGSLQGLSNGENTLIDSTWESYRRQIVLDYGLNANYQLMQNALSTAAATGTNAQGSDATLVNTGATVYKFYPPTLAKTGTTGYNYVAECSNRGICDSETGLCNCFAGYSGDDCGRVSSLVQ